MKVSLFLIALAVALAEARPRFLIIPMEDVEFVPHHRSARSAWPQDSQDSQSSPQAEFVRPVRPSNRREGGPPADGPAFFIPADIRGNEQIAQGSGPAPAITGGDAVDYGAYTGGYGAFGWYSDHPNFVGNDHHRRR